MSRRNKRPKEFNKNIWWFLWIVYGSLVVIYLLGCRSNDDPLLLQAGVFVLTIVAMVLIMLHNSDYQRRLTIQQLETMNENTGLQLLGNQESTDRHIAVINDNSRKQVQAIQDASDKEIRVITDQFRELQTEVSHLSKTLISIHSDEVVTRKHEQELDQQRAANEEERLRLLREEQSARMLAEKDQITRMKPKIQVRLERRSYAIFWHHYWLSIVNRGGEGICLKVHGQMFNSTTRNKSQRIDQYLQEIKQGTSHSFDIGNANTYVSFDKVNIRISIMDIENRGYMGEITFLCNSNSKSWQTIPLATMESL